MWGRLPLSAENKDGDDATDSIIWRIVPVPPARPTLPTGIYTLQGKANYLELFELNPPLQFMNASGPNKARITLKRKQSKT
jgi:hypothetical protein